MPLDLEEQENNIAKEELTRQELKRISRETDVTHTNLLAEASASSVTASLPSGDNPAAEEIDEIANRQATREAEERAKRAEISERTKLHLAKLGKRAVSDVEECHSPRGEPSDFTSDPIAVAILDKVKRRFSEKAPEIAGVVGSGALSLAGTVGSGALNVAGAVGSGALNVAGAVGSAVGSAVTNLARENIEAVQFLYENNREPAIQIAKSIANLVASKAKSDITHLFEAQKLNFANLKKVLEENRRLFQDQSQAGSAFSELEGPRTKYLTAADYNYVTGGTSSSSSPQPTPSGPPTSLAPSHATEMKKFNSIKEWMDHSTLKGFYMDQLQMREGWAQFMGLVDSDGFHVPDAGKKLRAKLGKTSVEDLAKTLLYLDGKEVK
jgi:hypothetical protein